MRSYLILFSLFITNLLSAQTIRDATLIKLANGDTTFISQVSTLRAQFPDSTSARNVPGGIGVYWKETNNQLVFKSLVAGSNITITSGEADSTITISSTGGSVTLDGEVNGPSTATRVDTVRRIWFDRDYNQPDSLAKLQWNAGDRTLDLGMGSTAQFNVLQIGQETLYPHAINKQAATIKKGVPVMVDTVTFVQGDNIRIMPATGSGSRPASTIMGLATHDIPFDSVGFVTWFGYVTEVVEADIAQTGITLNAGDILYVSGTQHGRLTNVAPTAPQLKIPIAILVRKQNVNNLTLLVRPNLTQDIHELNDVSVTSPTGGQVLEWNAAGYWENGQVGIAGIEANAIDSTKIRNAGISVLDIGVNGASNGQVLKYNGTQWAPAADDNTGTNLTFTGSGSPFSLNSSTGTGVDIASGTGITLTRATNQLTVTNSAPDQTVSITGAGINTVTGTYPTFTVTGTEVDGSVSNEGSLTVGAGTGSTSLIQSNTSGSTNVTLEAGSNITLTENTTTNTITIASSGGGVTDGDKGDIDVTNSGQTWTVDTSAVNNLKLASGAGGIYKGSGIVPDNTVATIAGYFGWEYDTGDGEALKINNTFGNIQLTNSTGDGYISIENDSTTVLFDNKIKFTGDTIDISEVTTKIGFPSMTIESAPANTSFSGVSTTFTANESQVLGDLVYINSAYKAQLGDADTIITSRILAMCTGTVSANNTGTYLMQGFITNNSWSFTQNQPVFLSLTGTSGNTLTQTAPTATNDCVVHIGVAVSATRIYFNPSQLIIELE